MLGLKYHCLYFSNDFLINTSRENRFCILDFFIPSEGQQYLELKSSSVGTTITVTLLKIESQVEFFYLNLMCFSEHLTESY